jgi:hypothetical protein
MQLQSQEYEKILKSLHRFMHQSLEMLLLDDELRKFRYVSSKKFLLNV